MIVHSIPFLSRCSNFSLPKKSKRETESSETVSELRQLKYELRVLNSEIKEIMNVNKRLTNKRLYKDIIKLVLITSLLVLILCYLQKGGVHW